MKLFLLPFLVAALAAPTGRPAGWTPVVIPVAAPERCPDTPMSLARKQGAGPEARKLGELPPARSFMAVDRRVDGCPAPMLQSELRGR